MKNFNLEKLTVFNNKLFTRANLEEYALPIKGIVGLRSLPLAFVQDNPDNASMVRIDLQPTNYEFNLEKCLPNFESLKNNYPKSYVKVNEGKISAYIPKKDEDRAILPLKQLLDSNDYCLYLKIERELPFVIGETVENKVICDDLAKLPHLLVAGTTGSGKSVMLNTIIASLLYQFDPSEVQFAMFDTKMIELTLYDKIPHLAYPIVTNADEADQVLEHLIGEMNRRLVLMMNARAVTINRYNKQAKVKLPYLVVIFDEFADLILSNKEVEKSIVALAQKGRACGIHLILATQRPDADVVTGQIKANIPATIALTVKNSVNSRIVLDENGAENLNKRGDMLYKNSDGLIRLQGAYLTEADKDMIVNSICEKFGSNKFYEKMIAQLNKVEEAPVEEVKPFEIRRRYVDGDIVEGLIVMDKDLYKACMLVITKGKCSRIMIRQELGYGDNRAQRTVDNMIEKKIVADYDEVKKCNQVLVNLEDFNKRYISQDVVNAGL